LRQNSLNAGSWDDGLGHQWGKRRGAGMRILVLGVEKFGLDCQSFRRRS
jgi:hypothetical protein